MAKKATDERTIDDYVDDYVRKTTGTFHKSEIYEMYLEDVKQGMKDPFRKDAMAREVANKRMTAHLAQLQRRATRAIKSRQMDWDIFFSSIISLGEGMYVTIENASVDAMEIKTRSVDDNYAAVVEAHDVYHAFVDPVSEYQIANDIATFGKAARLMGVVN